MHQAVGHWVLEQADLPYWDDSSELQVVPMSILSCLNLTMKIFLSDTVSLSWFFFQLPWMPLCWFCISEISDKDKTMVINTTASAVPGLAWGSEKPKPSH